MRPVRVLSGLLPAALLLALFPSLPGAEPEKPNEPGSARRKDPLAPGPGDVEVRFLDGSTLKLTLREPHITLVTPYGKLLIPIADLRRVDLATRIPPEAARRIEDAIADLSSSEFSTREKAGTALLEQGARAYPALLGAAASSDPEVQRRAEKLLARLRERIPENQLEPRKHDVVQTADSKIAGRIEEAVLKAHTRQFGAVEVKLADALVVRAQSPLGDEAAHGPIIADPGNLEGIREKVGKTLRIRVTGANNGFVFGTDTYTTDSTLATAAVHAGALAVGQTAVLRVTLVAPPPAFQGTLRNGVTSLPWGAYPTAYTIRR